MRKRNRPMAALAAAAAAVSLSIVGLSATAASAAVENPPLITGERTLTYACADGVVTFTVGAPSVQIEDAVNGGFIVNGVQQGSEAFAAGTLLSPFSRTSVAVPVTSLPETPGDSSSRTLWVEYWFDEPASIAFQSQFTIGNEACGVVPPAVTPTLNFTLTPSADGSGVDYSVTLGPDNVPLPQTVIIGYGAQDVAKELTFTEAGTQTGSFPWAPCGTYLFGVFIPDSPVGDGQSVTIPCPDPGDGGNNGGGDNGGDTGGTPNNGGTTNTGGTPNTNTGGTTPVVKTAPPAAKTGDVVSAAVTKRDVVSASSPFGYGLMGGGALLIVVLVAVMAVRSRKSSAQQG